MMRAMAEPASRYTLMLFDLDGTLVETSSEIADAANDTLQQAGLAPVPQQDVDRWIGHGTRALLVQALARSRGVPQEVVRAGADLPELVAAFDRHYERRCGTRSRLYPHVREVLDGLRSRGVALAVVTNKETRFTARVLAAHALTPYFGRVVSGDTMPVKKPDPAGVHSCLRHFAVEAARTLFVGDSSIDVATARNAGVAVWALPYGYNLGQPIEACAPDRVIADFRALLG